MNKFNIPVLGSVLSCTVNPQSFPALSMVTRTTASPQTITLSRITPSGGDVIVYWGDGSSDVISDGNTGNTSHQYTIAGDYTINVTNPDIITYIDVHSASLISLDVSKTVNTTYLSCYGNSLSVLDVTNLTLLVTFYVATNSLSALDVSNLTSLVTLNCSGNGNIGALDVSNLTNMVYLNCGSNKIKELDVTNLNKLTTLRYDNNGLSVEEHDAIVDNIWSMTQTRTPSDGTGDIFASGTNTDPSGTYQPASVCPPTDRLERVYEMRFDTCGAGFNKWATFTY